MAPNTVAVYPPNEERPPCTLIIGLPVRVIATSCNPRRCGAGVRDLLADLAAEDTAREVTMLVEGGMVTTAKTRSSSRALFCDGPQVGLVAIGKWQYCISGAMKLILGMEWLRESEIVTWMTARLAAYQHMYSSFSYFAFGDTHTSIANNTSQSTTTLQRFTEPESMFDPFAQLER